jgi:hypothetical protein
MTATRTSRARLAGGNIRSASITAAHRKLGRLVLEREFGGYLSLLR